MYQFFKPNLDELNSIIGKTLAPKNECPEKIDVVQTGWTNITMNVSSKNGEYIFRFPRNHFFAKAMVKDCMACRFLADKVSSPIPQMSLQLDQNRPYSMHPKIKGEPLDKIMPTLTVSEKKFIAEELAEFLVQLQSIPLAEVPAIMKKPLNQFLIELAGVHQGDYDLSRHALWAKTEQGTIWPCLSHGDFHPGNILIGPDKKVAGVIDFAFITMSDCHADLGRFVSRSDAYMSDALIQTYQKRSPHLCQFDKIQQMADLFHYVDHKYVQYMQRAHPEIIIPKMLMSPTK